MNVKKVLRLTAFVVFTAIAVPAYSSNITTDPSPADSAAMIDNMRAQQLMQRLEYIKGIDKSGLTRSEKKDLRKEVKDTKKEMKHMGGGIYLSVGAVIIIILLLILIL